MNSTCIIPRVTNSYETPLLIKSILKQSLYYEPDNEIRYRDIFRMNYRTLNRRIAQLAHALTDAGIQAGDVVGVIDYDSHRYLELYFAVPMIGAVLHTINYRLPPEQIIYTVNHAEDKAVFCHEDFIPLLNGIKNKLETAEIFVLLSDKKDTSVPIPFLSEYESMIKGEPVEYDFPDFDENSLATLFYTTGTTGKPKGVYFSHRQLVLHTISVMTALSAIDSPVRIHSSDVYMPMTPMFHVHAWGIPYVSTFLGMKQIYPGKYEPEMLMKLILTEKVTFSHCVPTILNMLVSNPKTKDLDISHFRVIIGGSALPAGLAKATLGLGIDIITGYGLSETCPVLTVTYLPHHLKQKMNVDDEVAERIKTGRAIPFVELRLIDDEGRLLPFDGKTVGELIVRAPWLTQGYFKEEERSKDLWEGGYLHTGDMAYIEPNGTVVICDRKKDIIKSGGEWISSIDMESLLSAHQAVKECAVIGLKDEKWGERPIALIVLNEGKIIHEEDIKNHLQQFIQSGHLSKWAVPDEFIFCKEIPKTSVGKIDKKLIRMQLAGGK
jgi:fatty-acyl-CoA synthase